MNETVTDLPPELVEESTRAVITFLEGCGFDRVFSLMRWWTRDGFVSIDPVDLARAIIPLIIAHERERCAKIADEMGKSLGDNSWNQKIGQAENLRETCDDIASAIRNPK